MNKINSRQRRSDNSNERKLYSDALNGNLVADISAFSRLNQWIFSGHEESVFELIQSGVNVDGTNEVGETALHAATLNGNKRIIGLLIQNGANVKVANTDGDTVLHFAAQNGNSKSPFFQMK